MIDSLFFQSEILNPTYLARKKILSTGMFWNIKKNQSCEFLLWLFVMVCFVILFTKFNFMFTFAGDLVKNTVCVPLDVLLVVVNMTLLLKPFKVTAICGSPSVVCILHRSQCSWSTEPLYLSVATNTYDGGSPSGNKSLQRINW